MDHTKCI